MANAKQELAVTKNNLEKGMQSMKVFVQVKGDWDGLIHDLEG